MLASGRNGFTLLELLLVLAVLAAVASIVLPQTGILLGDRQLVRSGEIVRIELTRLRVDAMRQGRVMIFQGELEGNSFEIKPFQSFSDATESMEQVGSQSALLTGASQALAVAPQGSSTTRNVPLTEGVTIESVATVSAARAFEIQQSTEAATQTGNLSQPILFYPDGSTSTAAVTLKHETMGRIVVKLRGITGDATVSEVLPL